MKKLNQFFTGCLIGLLSIAALGSCSHQPRAKKTIIFVLKDETELTRNQARQCPEEKLTPMIFGVDNTGYGEIFFSKLSCVAANIEQHAELSDLSNEDNTVNIQDAQEAFDTLLHKGYLKCMDSSKGDSNSRLYVPVVEKINRLNKMQGDKKVLIMIGDGVEYSQEGNFYKNSFLHKDLTPDTAKVNAQIRFMENVVALPDNPKNLTVIFLFLPDGSKKSERDHENAMAVWRALFKKHGIPLIEKPNL